MNRYLIVVFCVLTGCAAAIPMANAEELTVDRQLFIEWCNDHIQDFDENLSSPILAQVEKKQIKTSCISRSRSFNLLKNLPKIPALSQQNGVLHFPLPEFVISFIEHSSDFVSAVSSADHPIRAPGLLA